MPLRRVFVALFALISLSTPARSNPRISADVTAALGRLSAASSDERNAAERELAKLLVSSDVPLLANAARTGSAEVRARIASALMSSERHLALAAELAASDDATVAGTGADALAGLAADWLGTTDQEPLPMASIERELTGMFSGFWSLDVQRCGLEETLDRIARLVDGRRADRPGAPEPALVLDPRYDPARARPLKGAEEIVSPAIGSFEALAYAAAVTHGAVFDVYGWNDGRTWLVVRDAASPSARPAQLLLREWVLAVQRPASLAAARSAARALASSGWPAALEWLDTRWREKQDPAALDGLVLAAGRGALGSSLATKAGAELLLERADRALNLPGDARPEAREAARALLTLGSIGSEVWARGFNAASPRGKMLRCALLAATRADSPELLALLEARWTAGAVSSEERCALLRALASSGAPRVKSLPAVGLEPAFEWAAAHGEGVRFLGDLRAVGAGEPVAWQDARGLAAALQVELCADALARAGSGAAQDALAGVRLCALLAGKRGEENAQTLLDRESLWLPKAKMRAALLAARAKQADSATIVRLLVCSDVATPEETSEAAASTFAREEWNDADWRVAGAGAAAPGGTLERWPLKETKPDERYIEFLTRLEQVRDQLTAAAKDPGAASKPALDPRGLEAGWVQGCSRTLLLLRARQCEPGAREFLRRLRILFQRSQHPLRRELSGGRFPALSAAILVEVEPREPWIGF